MPSNRGVLRRAVDAFRESTAGNPQTDQRIIELALAIEAALARLWRNRRDPGVRQVRQVVRRLLRASIVAIVRGDLAGGELNEAQARARFMAGAAQPRFTMEAKAAAQTVQRRAKAIRGAGKSRDWGDRVRAAIRDNPGMSNYDLADLLRCSEPTVRRYRKKT